MCRKTAIIRFRVLKEMKREKKFTADNAILLARVSIIGPKKMSHNIIIVFIIRPRQTATGNL